MSDQDRITAVEWVACWVTAGCAVAWAALTAGDFPWWVDLSPVAVACVAMAAVNLQR